VAPAVSVCISVLNMASLLVEQLAALVAQRDAPAFEVVVVDDGSEDDPAAAIAPFAGRLRVQTQRVISPSGLNRARNLAVSMARADKILFCDADDIVGERWVVSLADALERADLVSGVARESREGVFVGEWGGQVRLGFLPSPIGASCGFRRAAFDAIGGFDESWRSGGDEYDFFFRAQLAGATFEHVPEAVVDYRQATRSPRDAFRRSASRARGDARLYSRFGAEGMPRSSSLGALRSLGAVLKRVPRITDIEERRVAAHLLGRRWGRISGSWAHRCWYP